MLDEQHEPPLLPNEDENTYTYGSINRHNVVIACLPPGQPGKVSAAILVQPLRRSFPNIQIHLFVGIGGGVPGDPPLDDPDKDIRLGDVVVGWPDDTGAPAVVQYDLTRREEDGKPNSLSRLDKPDRRLLSALGALLAKHAVRKTMFREHLKKMSDLPDFAHPGLEHDKLYKSTYAHAGGPTCSSCDHTQLVERKPRKKTDLVFHQSTIASGDSVMKNAKERDEISKAFHGARCFEMEAAGVMDLKHCLVIRGIADYADSHKNHSWQNYAAATAAAFAREFLCTIQTRVLEDIPVGGNHVKRVPTSEEKALLNDLYDVYLREKLSCLDPPGRVEGTCEWILDHPTFFQWNNSIRGSLLWITGNAGCGKTMLSSYLIEELRRSGDADQNLCSFFCNGKIEPRTNATSILGSLLFQILSERHDLLHFATRLYTSRGKKMTTDFDGLWQIFAEVVQDPTPTNTIVVVDGLDECDASSRDRFFENLLKLLDKPRASLPIMSSGSSWPRLGILFTSRPYQSIEAKLQSTSIIRLKTEDETFPISMDISRFIEAKTKKLQEDTGCSNDTMQYIAESLHAKADGTFLWVDLVVKLLKEEDDLKRSTAVNFLVGVPPELSELYKKILRDITKKWPKAVKILRIILGARRPLSLKELNFAVHTEIHHESLADIYSQLWDRPERSIKMILGPFVRISLGNVHLIHQSTKDFLESNSANVADPQSELHEKLNVLLAPSETNLSVLKLCVTFLCLKDFDQACDENLFDQYHVDPDPLDLYRPNYSEQLNATVWNIIKRVGEPYIEFRCYPAKNCRKDVSDTFYMYATGFWDEHLRMLSDDLFEMSRPLAMKLLRQDTLNLAHWFRLRLALDARNKFFRPEELTRLSRDHGMSTVRESLLPASVFCEDLRLIKHIKSLEQNSSFISEADRARAEAIDTVLFYVGQSSSPQAREYLEYVKRMKSLGKISSITGADRGKAEAKDTAIFYAIQSGSLEIVKEVEYDGFAKNYLSRFKMTPVAHALRLNHSKGSNFDLEIYLSSITSPRDTDAEDAEGRTSFSRAAELGRLGLVKKFIATGDANLNARASGGNNSDDDDVGCSPLSFAARNGHLAVVAELCAHESVFVDDPDDKGRTPFLHACSNWGGQEEQVHIVRVLLETNRVRTDVVDSEGSTPLLQACRSPAKGQEYIVRHLLDNDRAQIRQADSTGRTPISYAAQRNVEVLRALIIMASRDTETIKSYIDQADSSGRTPFSYAAEVDMVEALEILLGEGADVDCPDNGGRTPLSYAACSVRSLYRGNNAEVSLGVHDLFIREGRVNPDRRGISADRTRLSALDNRTHVGKKVDNFLLRLLASGKVDINARDLSGRTPLSWAASGYDPNVDVLSRLLQQDSADPNSQDDLGKTPLFWAVEDVISSEASVEILLQSGKVDVNIRDKGGRTPFSMACGSYVFHNPNFLDFDTQMNNWRLLLDTGCVDVHPVDSNGRTALSRAAERGRAEAVAAILKIPNLNVDLADNTGRTPLAYACLGCWDPSVRKYYVYKHLSHKGAEGVYWEIDVSPSINIDHSIEINHIRVVSSLLSTGKVDTNRKDKYGRTPLDYAKGAKGCDVSEGNSNRPDLENWGVARVIIDLLLKKRPSFHETSR